MADSSADPSSVPVPVPEHISYPHTVSFGNFKANTLRRLKSTAPYPEVANYIGTTKIHGTNATIIFRTSGSSTAPQIQSRNKVLLGGNIDNAGTYAFLSTVPLESLRQQILALCRPRPPAAVAAGSDSPGELGIQEIYVAGELAGKGVQAKVGISEVDKFYCIFNIRIDGEWVDMREFASVKLPQYRVFNIIDFGLFEVTIDLRSETTTVLKEMMEKTNVVVACCPVAERLVGIKGPGEGIVWTLCTSDPRLRRELHSFKTKGEALATTKKVADQNKEKNAAFAEYAVTERRLEQGLEYLREMGEEIDESNVNMFCKWVCDDALAEERNKAEEMGVSMKAVRKVVVSNAKAWFFLQCTEQINRATA